MSYSDEIKITEIVPKVCLIGRPNVGKSTLFNILTDSRKSVVKNQPGVTRDIMLERADVWGKEFDLIDTGGITEAQDTFSKLIKEQVIDFLESADFLIAICDGRAGLIPEDREIIKIAKQTGKPFLLVVNKIDREHEAQVLTAEFYEFGVDLVSCSFERRHGIAEILEWIHKNIPQTTQPILDSLRISIVGKPNVGKSSLVNSLLGEKRMIVSDIAGTTVDAVDTPFYYNNIKYTLIDTAGLRRSSKREEDLEIISSFKTQESIRKADVVLLVVDATIGPTEQDAKILQSIEEMHKTVILVVNKSDLGRDIDDFKKTIRLQVEENFHFFTDIRIVFVSAKSGSGLQLLMEEIETVGKLIKTRISTSELNSFFTETIRKAPSPVYATTNVKFYYLTQTKQVPPSFIAFANHPDGVLPSYRRFLVKNLKERFGLHGIAIRIFVMKSGGRS